MTEEELKRLCAKLRREYYDGEYAASEIERLAALAQSDAGDATWREFKKRMDMGTKEAIAALAQSDEFVTLDEIEAAMDRVLERRGFHAASPDRSGKS